MTHQSLAFIFSFVVGFENSLDSNGLMISMGDKLDLLSSRYLFTINVYHGVSITKRTNKVFLLELLVGYSSIVFLFNLYSSGIPNTTRFLGSTHE